MPAPNDACAGAEVLPANTTVVGTTVGAADDFNNTLPNQWYGGSPKCGFTFPGADVVYAYTASASGPVTVTLQPQRGFDAALSVLSACSENRCIESLEAATSDKLTITFEATSGTTYSIVVDSAITATSTTSTTSRGGFLISAE